MSEFTDKPTLLVTTSTFPRWLNDKEPRFIYDLCTHLTDVFNVIILAPSAPGARSFEQDGMLKIYRYRYAPRTMEALAYNGGITANLKDKYWKYLLLPGFLFCQWLAIQKLLRLHPIAAIHAHWFVPQGIVAAAVVNKKNNIALLTTSHGSDLLGLQDKLSLSLKRWVIKKSSALTVVSQTVRDQLTNLQGNRPLPVRVLPMGTDLTKTFKPNGAIIRKTSQLLFVGRLVEKKGVEVLINAFQEVTKTHPELTLIIVGSGPLEGTLKKTVTHLALDRAITFTGKLNHEELACYYQESTITVIPSEQEGFGLAVVEAIGCGCPVIASDLPSIKDIIQDEETGYLCQPGDVQALSKTIEKALSKPDHLLAMATTARLSVQQRFSWEAISGGYKKILQEI